MADFVKTSFLDDFTLPDVTNDAVRKQLKKVSHRSTTTKKSFDNLPLDAKIEKVTEEVYKIFRRYKGFVRVIRDNDEYMEYVSKAIEFGELAFDTETDNSLDPLTCKLMGLCCYLPNTKPVYVPISHCTAGTDILLERQVSLDCVIKSFEMIRDSDLKMIYHNGKFDIRVCYNVTGIYLPIYWDTMLAAQLIDENELAKLKYQYKSKIDPTMDVYNIESLFKHLPYAWMPPEVFALYASIDSYDTYKVYRYQKRLFEGPGMEDLYKLFLTIEVPTASVVAEMEDNGICMDLEFLGKLDAKYKNKMSECMQSLNAILEEHKSSVEYYQDIGKLDNPVNFDSPAQLSIVLYDVIGVSPVGGERSTDKTTLEALGIDFTKNLLEYRHYSKLVTSFTSPLPGWLSKKDGKLHASFNQMGKEENNVRTGRFSSTDPKIECWGFVA